MSVHTFFTGIRGVLAPLVAFHLVAVLEIETLGWISGGHDPCGQPAFVA
jgi:hypothetical protein